MKLRRRSVIVAAVLSMLIACAKAPPSLSPAGKATFQAIQAVRVLDTIRDVAIAGEAQTPKVFTTDTTRKVVLFHRSTVQTIGAVPNGWKAVALEAVTQLQKDVPPAEWTKLAPYVSLLRVIVQEVP